MHRHRPPTPASTAPPARGQRPKPEHPFRDLLMVAVAVAALAACARASGPAGRPLAVAVADTISSDSFRQARVFRSEGGVLDIRMAVIDTILNVPLDSSATLPLRTYDVLTHNGRTVDYEPSYPGPTFWVKRGDLVRINLINQLGASADSVCEVYPASTSGQDVYPDCFHGPNYTNIHYHGTHVTPDSSGDNVLIQVAPGDSFQTSFIIPWNQSPGTHWYHPHKHGSVALQVTNAMSGALVIEGGGLDSLTRAWNIRQYLLAVQQIDSQVNLVDGNFGATTVVNGLANPEIPMRPNEVIRVRIVNENVSHTASYALFFSSGTKVWDIARDGVQFDPANYDTLDVEDSLYMAPGNRLDVFIRAPATEGTYELRARVPNLGRRLSNRVLQQGGRLLRPNRDQNATTPLARIRVVAARGASYTDSLPAELPALPNFLANVGPTSGDSAMVVFLDSGSQNKSHANPTAFFLGNAQNHYMKYNPNVVYIPTDSSGDSLPMVVGDSQTWKVENYGIAFNHPFHIHINPFQVVEVFAPDPTDGFGPYYADLNAAADSGHPIWMDVVPLPLPLIDTINGQVDTIPGYVILRQRYEDFTGQFVMHCHVLGHEERGMMQLIEIFSPDSVPTARSRSRRSEPSHGAHRR